MDQVILRTPHAASQIPQDLPENVLRRPRGERHRCETHDCELDPVVITTYSDLGDPAMWRARPLAHDGWRCEVGGHLELGAHLSPDEIDALTEAGSRAAQSGDLDGAEYHFRRVVSAWPGFASGHSNLGAVYLDRVGASQRAGASEETWRPLLDVAIRELSRALACEPPAGPQTRMMLERIQARLRDQGHAAVPVAGDPEEAPVHESEASSKRGATFEHRHLTLTLPPGWRSVEVPEGLTAMFEGPDFEIVNVVLMTSPAVSEAHLEHMMSHHESAIRNNYSQCDSGPPQRTDQPTYLCSDRVYNVSGEGRPWTIHARYVISRHSELQTTGLVHPVIQVAYYGSSWGPSADVVDAIRGARLLPYMAMFAKALAPRPEPVLSLEEAIDRSEIGASRAAVEAQWPRDTAWTWDAGRQTLLGHPEAIAPFQVKYDLPKDALTAIHILTRAVGDWSTMELLEQHLMYQLPSFTFTSLRDPWTSALARGRLEGKGNARMMMGVPIAGKKPDGTQISGKAFAFNVEGRQTYGFELVWRL